jgi:hypothetical protein
VVSKSFELGVDFFEMSAIDELLVHGQFEFRILIDLFLFAVDSSSWGFCDLE